MQETTLICAANWLGDSIMAMPALQVYRQRRPEQRILMLVRPPLEQLWRMHSAVDGLIAGPRGVGATLKAIQAVRREAPLRAFVWPNSFRSALIPFAARVPERTGRSGHLRSSLLTRVIPESTTESRHQQWEYFAIMGVEAGVDGPPAPALALAPDAPLLSEQPEGGGPLVGLIPGAARGRSKQWPAQRFTEAARALMRIRGCRFAVFGTAAERALCASVAEPLGASAVNLAGRTDLASLAAALHRCDAVLTNDCGGMHLAAAAGTRVVAVFGLTDPGKTGPLGVGHRVLVPRGVQGGRDIPRASVEAEAALASIPAEQAAAAVMDVLDEW